MTILVMSYRGDAHADYVIRKANQMGVDAVLFNPSEFPDYLRATYDAYTDKDTPRLTLEIDGRCFHDDQIAGVWARRTGRDEPSHRFSMGSYIVRESEVVIRSLNELLPNANWVSDPERTRLANRKPVQLKMAQQVGFRVPATCITNSSTAAEAFLDATEPLPLTIKPVRTALIQLSAQRNTANAKNKVIFTRKVERQFLRNNLSLVENCPIILQEAMEKDLDIRVTVVDDRVFSAAIRTENCADPTNLDWRNYEGTRTYKRHRLPKAIEAACRRVLTVLGLRFGCFDLGYSDDLGYVFFEVNSQGQWLPSEQRLGYDISGALIGSLTTKNFK